MNEEWSREIDSILLILLNRGSFNCGLTINRLDDPSDSSPFRKNRPRAYRSVAYQNEKQRYYSDNQEPAVYFFHRDNKGLNLNRSVEIAEWNV